MGNSRNLGLLFTESQCCFTTHLREDYIHYANPSHLSTSNPSIKGARMVSLGSGLLGLPAGSKTPCVNDMQSSLREKEEGGAFAQNMQKCAKSLLLLLLARIDMQGAPHSKNCRGVDFQTIGWGCSAKS